MNNESKNFLYFKKKIHIPQNVAFDHDCAGCYWKHKKFKFLQSIKFQQKISIPTKFILVLKKTIVF